MGAIGDVITVIDDRSGNWCIQGETGIEEEYAGRWEMQYIRGDIAHDMAEVAKELLEDYEKERKGWTDEAYDFTRPLVDNMKAALERYYESRDNECDTN